MKHLLLVLSIFLFSIGLFAGDWRGQMKDLAKTLGETIPLLYPDPGQNSKALTAKVKLILDITKSLDDKLSHSSAVPDDDPALPYIASLFRRDIERAYKSLTDGHTDYAKSVVRASVGYCIACHTRTADGTEFPLLKAFSEPLKKASWIERIEFQAASRQFEPVVAEVMGQLKGTSGLNISALDLERASRVALAILVRVKKDPTRARFLTQAVLESKSASLSLKESARQWQKDISAWQAEKPLEKPTDDIWLSKARQLTSAEGTGSEVRLLRASVFMLELLKAHPNTKHEAEAYYLIGRAYDSLRELGLWSLHEMYYLACIDRMPNSKVATTCYNKYEESVTLGYSGSRGTHLPAGVRRHLTDLKKRAQVKK